MTIKLDAKGSTVTNNVFYLNECPLCIPAVASIGDGNVFHKDVEGSAPLKNSNQYVFVETTSTGYSTINSTAELNISEIAYHIEGHLLVDKDGKLCIGNKLEEDNFVTLKFYQNGYIYIKKDGEYSYDPSTSFFTSIKDSSKYAKGNTYNSDVAPADGDWTGIEIYNPDDSNYWDNRWNKGPNVKYNDKSKYK